MRLAGLDLWPTCTAIAAQVGVVGQVAVAVVDEDGVAVPVAASPALITVPAPAERIGVPAGSGEVDAGVQGAPALPVAGGDGAPGIGLTQAGRRLAGLLRLRLGLGGGRLRLGSAPGWPPSGSASGSPRGRPGRSLAGGAVGAGRRPRPGLRVEGDGGGWPGGRCRWRRRRRRRGRGRPGPRRRMIRRCRRPVRCGGRSAGVGGVLVRTELSSCTADLHSRGALDLEILVSDRGVSGSGDRDLGGPCDALPPGYVPLCGRFDPEK